MSLSKYVSRDEFERSQTAARRGLPNKMNADQVRNAKHLCTEVLDRIREYYKAPILISSGFRAPAVNVAVGGSGTSQHCKGEAADFTIAGKSVEQVYQDIRTGRIPGIQYDQLIQEFGGWVHISAKRLGGNRKQELRAVNRGGSTVYIPE